MHQSSGSLSQANDTMDLLKNNSKDRESIKVLRKNQNSQIKKARLIPDDDYSDIESPNEAYRDKKVHTEFESRQNKKKKFNNSKGFSSNQITSNKAVLAM